MTYVDSRPFGEGITVEMLDEDPYPIYARMREEFPVCWVPAVGLWFVTRWDDVQHVVTHPDLFTADVARSPLRRALGENVLTVDGEVHKRLRGPIETGLRPRAVDAWAPGSSARSPSRCSTRSRREAGPTSWRRSSSP